jgi:plastocyanin
MRSRALPFAIPVLIVLSAGCGTVEDPKPAVTGNNNITAPTTAARSTATTGRSGTSATTIAVAPNSVVINDYTFIPGELDVAVGTTVTWSNTESSPPVDHWVKTATGQTGDLDSGRMAPGATYTKAFDQPGEYSYFCNIHNFMKAKVVVR